MRGQGGHSRAIVRFTVLMATSVLAAALAAPANAAFPGGNGRIALDVVRFFGADSATDDILTVSRNGGDPQWLRMTDHTQEEDPNYSPNGNLITFWTTGHNNHTWTIRSNGANLHKVGKGTEFDFAASGHRIIFQKRDGGLASMNLNGNRVHTILSGRHLTGTTSRHTVCDDAAATANGKWIVYVVREALPGHKGLSGIYKVHPNGKGRKRLTNRHALDVDVSPNSGRFVFSKYTSDGFDLWGGKIRRRGSHPLIQSSGVWETFPFYSPTGSRIAFGRYEGGPIELWSFRPPSGPQQRLSTPGYEIHNGDWQPR